MINYDKLLKLLAEKGYSQSYISTKMGMSRGYLRDCIKNNTDIPKERLLLICGLLDTTPSYLCDKEDDRFEKLWLSMVEARRIYDHRLRMFGEVVEERLSDKEKARELFDMISKMTTKQAIEFEKFLDELMREEK